MTPVMVWLWDPAASTATIDQSFPLPLGNPKTEPGETEEPLKAAGEGCEGAKRREREEEEAFRSMVLRRKGGEGKGAERFERKTEESSGRRGTRRTRGVAGQI